MVNRTEVAYKIIISATATIALSEREKEQIREYMEDQMGVDTFSIEQEKIES